MAVNKQINQEEAVQLLAARLAAGSLADKTATFHVLPSTSNPGESRARGSNIHRPGRLQRERGCQGGGGSARQPCMSKQLDGRAPPAEPPPRADFMWGQTISDVRGGVSS